MTQFRAEERYPMKTQLRFALVCAVLTASFVFPQYPVWVYVSVGVFAAIALTVALSVLYFIEKEW